MASYGKIQHLTCPREPGLMLILEGTGLVFKVVYLITMLAAHRAWLVWLSGPVESVEGRGLFVAGLLMNRRLMCLSLARGSPELEVTSAGREWRPPVRLTREEGR